MGKVENEVGTNNDIEMGKKPDFAFKLKFDVSQVEKYASEYSYERSESEVIKNSLKIRDRGYLTKSELQIIGNWKTPRSKPKIAANSEHYVKEVTSIAFSTKNEKLRIEILNLLEGVSWSTASVLLHFYHIENYPILDFRALYSISCEHIKPQYYNFIFWLSYTEFIRNLADKAGADMRTIDQALWQYSKKYQKPNIE